MKYLGIVVLYYPDKNVLNNILSYAPLLDKLIVWDNTPLADQEKLFPANYNSDNILQMGYGKNVGIGAALNEAVKYGQLNEFTHLLTMDQDSCFAEGMFHNYITMLQLIKDETIKSFTACGNKNETGLSKIVDVNICITSGTTYLLSVFKEIGLFRDDFFIDGIDTEFSFRLTKHGFRMVRFNDVFMHHVLGQMTVTPFLWGKLISPNYPAQRTYYIVRNTLLLERLYPNNSTGMLKSILYWRPITILFVETNKWHKFKAIIIGIIHSYTGKLGEYTIRT